MVDVGREQNASLAQCLMPEGYRRPALGALLGESAVVAEAARMVRASTGPRRRRTPWVASTLPRSTDPVLLIPGFLAGDASLLAMSRRLRSGGFRTYRSHIRANVGCTQAAVAQLETRLESVAIRRGSRVALVGHSLGGMLARGVAARRPDLVSNVVTLGSPMLAPGAHHLLLTASLDVLTRLSRAGVPGLMAEDCVAGQCARDSFEESRSPMPAGVGFTAVYSRRDGVVDWRACVDPDARAIEVTCSHLGMAVDPQTLDVVSAALRRPEYAGRAPVAAWSTRPVRRGSVLEVDRGESA